MTKQLPRLVMNAVLVILSTLGTVFCVTTAFDLAVNIPVIILTCILSALLLTGGFLWKPLRWGLLGLVVLLAVAAFLTDMFAPLSPTLTQLLHDILTRYSSAYPTVSFPIPAAPESAAGQSMTLLFSILTVILTVWTAWGIGYRSCLITVAGTLPFLLLCVVINDTPPHAFPLVLLLSVWITILMCKERHDEPASMDAARLGITLMAVLLVVGIIGTVYPKQDTAQKPLPEVVQNIIDLLPQPMQDLLDRETKKAKYENIGADTDEILDLTQQGPRQRTDTVTMQVSCTESGILYLKAAAKDIYTGKTWESRDKAGVSDSLYAHTSLGQAYGSIYQAAIEVHNYRDNPEVCFAPYGLISCTGAMDITGDLRIGAFDDNYITYFWPGIGTLDLSEAVGIPNSTYDSYVHETCLELNHDTRQTLYDLALAYGYNPALSTVDTIAWVVEFLHTVAEYELEVPCQPYNYDFALYFLTESREGYCVHFATAAAAMFRALDIPARYASGYRVELEGAGEITDVTDEDTHAWCEVYLGGLGWIPVETTPGFEDSLLLPDVEHQPKEPEVIPEITPEPTPTPSEEPSPSPSPSPEASEEPAVPSPSPDNTVGPGIGPDSSDVPLWAYAAAIPVILILGFLVLLLRRIIVVKRRKRRFRTDDTNQSVIYHWTYLERLIPWGAEPSRAQEALALKAKFSQHRITDEELAGFKASVAATAETTQQTLTGFRRFRFKWLSCLSWKKKRK